MNSIRIESDSEDSEIFVVRKKRKKSNPFIDDEANGSSDDTASDGESDADSDGNLDGFIDDSEEVHENDFEMNKKTEIQVNRDNVLKFLSEQTESALQKMGLAFVYSHPEDLFE